VKIENDSRQSVRFGSPKPDRGDHLSANPLRGRREMVAMEIENASKTTLGLIHFAIKSLRSREASIRLVNVGATRHWLKVTGLGWAGDEEGDTREWKGANECDTVRRESSFIGAWGFGGDGGGDSADKINSRKTAKSRKRRAAAPRWNGALQGGIDDPSEYDPRWRGNRCSIPNPRSFTSGKRDRGRSER